MELTDKVMPVEVESIESGARFEAWAKSIESRMIRDDSPLIDHEEAMNRVAQLIDSIEAGKRAQGSPR
ncbi:MAG: hypothetical protein Q4B17_08280 [Lautropia sp.]|nr:hypothetical protein [Lautropia sp.]